MVVNSTNTAPTGHDADLDTAELTRVDSQDPVPDESLDQRYHFSWGSNEDL